MTAGNSSATWILHLSRNGQWNRTVISASRGSGVGVGDLALVPGTTTLWGSGGLLTTAGGDAAVWDHGIDIDRLALRVHRPLRSHEALVGRGVIRVYLALGNQAAVRVFLIPRHYRARVSGPPPPQPALNT